MAIARRHVMVDLWLAEADAGKLAVVGDWPDILLTAAKISGATVISHQFHQFEPQGVTGFLLLAESHISVHTWPEEGFAAVDIFTCGDMDIELMVEHLRQQLNPQKENVTYVMRGSKEG